MRVFYDCDLITTAPRVFWGGAQVMNTLNTLRDLVDQYTGATHYVYADKGSGAGFGAAGQALPYDADADQAYGDTEMMPLIHHHVSADGVVCQYTSDWLTTTDTHNNEYQYKIYF